jgi:hypothetical protein
MLAQPSIATPSLLNVTVPEPRPALVASTVGVTCAVKVTAEPLATEADDVARVVMESSENCALSHAICVPM